MASFYISSTYLDLIIYRDAVYRTLRKLRHDAVGMEDYIATDQRPVDKCLEDVRSCDVYIGIIAWKRGFIPKTYKDSFYSITELEYLEAKKCNKPCLIFLASPAAPWPAKYKEQEENISHKFRSIYDFRQELESNHIVSYFENQEQLALFVSISVRKWEIDNGVNIPIPALEDQKLPKGLKIISYIPSKLLKVKCRLNPIETFIEYVFSLIPILFFGYIAYSFVNNSDPLDSLIPLTLSCLMLGFFIYNFFKGTRIYFNFETKWVTMIRSLACGKYPASVNGIELVTFKSLTGWRSIVKYQFYILVKSDVYSSKLSARKELLNFATALNYALGSYELVEKELDQYRFLRRLRNKFL